MARFRYTPGYSAFTRALRSSVPLALAGLLSAVPVIGAEPLFIDSGDELTTFFGNLSKAAALGDIDGDGDVDSVVAQGGFSSGEPNAIWLNDGTGAFTLAEVTLGLGDSTDVALADFDGDGDLDVMAAGDGLFIGPLTIFWNVWNEGGEFVAGPELRTDGEIYLLAAGQLDGDAWPDVFLSTGDGDFVWWNQGDGSFAPGTSQWVDNASSVTLGDLDGDGDLDGFITRRSVCGGAASWRQRLREGTLLTFTIGGHPACCR